MTRLSRIIFLCLSWASLVWIVVLWLSPNVDVRTPLGDFLDRAFFRTGVTSIVGGCLGVLYLRIGDKDEPLAVWGWIAVGLNFLYALFYYAIVKQIGH